MATAVKPQSGAGWREEAEKLAQRRHLNGAALYVGSRGGVAHTWRVPSRSRGAFYLVTIWPEINAVQCTCHASVFGKACAHAGAALIADSQRRIAIAQAASDPFRTFAVTGQW